MRSSLSSTRTSRLRRSHAAASPAIPAPTTTTSRTACCSLIGQPLAYERVEGVWGNREVPPHETRRRGFDVGETWFPPRERAEGERLTRRATASRGEAAPHSRRRGPPGRTGASVRRRRPASLREHPSGSCADQTLPVTR